MKKGIVLAVICILIVVMVTSFLKKEIAANQQLNDNVTGEAVDLRTTLLGTGKAPDFSLETIDGELFTLSDFQGEKNVILNFWATWCEPCRAEMPEYQFYYEKYSEKDEAVILAVNMTHAYDSEEKVRQFKETYDLTFPILLEKQQSVSDWYEIITIPSTFIIDKEGKVRHYVKGPMTASSLHEALLEINK